MSPAIRLCPQQRTSSTFPVPIASISICNRIFMPLWTMSLSCIKRCHILLTTEHIDFVSHWIKVLRIYTGRITTNMVKLQTFWNHALQQFICMAMRQLRSAVKAEFAIALGIAVGAPKPTRAKWYRSILVYLSPEPLFITRKGLLPCQRVAISSPSHVVTFAITVRSTKALASWTFTNVFHSGILPQTHDARKGGGGHR